MSSTLRPGTELRPRHRPRLSLSTAAVGFLAGVLVAALALPERSEVVLDSASEGIDGQAAIDGAGSTGTDGAPTAAGAAGPGGRAAATSRTGTATGGTAPGSGPAGGTSGRPGAAARGVTATAVTIGFGLPDLGAIGALGPGYDQGDPRSHVEAILAELRASGRLPVHGRDIEPVYSSYNILSPEAQRATCEQFGNDSSVFAVVAIHDFGTGSECVAREFGLPVFTSDGQGDPVYARSDPNLFTMQMSANRMFRNFVTWADQSGYLDGKRIGVYYPSEPEPAKVVQDSILQPLKALGHNVVTEMQTNEPDTGGPTDSVAVQRFSADRVQVAILVVSAIAKTNFFTQAQTQAYKPVYLENDAGFSTTDTATSTYPASYFDGTRAFTGMRFGELRSGIPEPEQAAWCRAAIKRQGGPDIPVQGRDAEYIAANQACDEILTVLHGLEQAGPALTHGSFVAGVETVRDRPMGIHGNVTFARERHDGVSTWREITWHSDCRCWKVSSDLRPLLVP